MPVPDRGQDIGPEPSWNGIGGIKPPAIGAAIEPMGHDARNVIGAGGFSMIEGDKLMMALERCIVGLFAQSLVRRRDQAKPRGFRGTRPSGECALKQRLLTADMIEHAVEH